MEDLDGTTYRPEFLTRPAGLQNTPGFQHLELPTIPPIVKQKMHDLMTAYAHHPPDVNIHAFHADRYNPKIGAHGPPGTITTELEPRIVNALLNTHQHSATFLVRHVPDPGQFHVTLTTGEIK